jgi:hypothetical protein
MVKYKKKTSKRRLKGPIYKKIMVPTRVKNSSDMNRKEEKPVKKLKTMVTMKKSKMLSGKKRKRGCSCGCH